MKRAAARVALGAVAALPAALYLWSFTVDDAFISARYAAHLAAGIGYRFNPGGPVTDGVTPLGWALLLAPLASGGVLSAWHAAKWLGLLAWLAGAGALGDAIGTLEGSRFKWAALVLVLSSAPLGAWSVAGMETGVVLGLSCWAVWARARGRDTAAALLAGLVAGWRPEAVVWAAVFALAPARAPSSASAPRRALRGALALAPFGAALLVRKLLFGRALPLAAMAKPSDWAHGWRYALACAILCGVVALLGWRRVPGWIRGLQAATGAHLLALAVAGGDWMPLSRLMVVAMPALVLAAAQLAALAPRWWGGLRLLLAAGGQLFVMVTVAPRAAAVGPKRLAVIEQLRPAIAASQVVATLDVGWVGAAADVTVVDLAGVTDPAVAALPGGHTSKRIAPSLLFTRRVDALVLLLADGEPLAEPWTHSHFARQVELSLAWMPGMEREFSPEVVSDGALRYVLLRRVAELPSDPPEPR